MISVWLVFLVGCAKTLPLSEQTSDMELATAITHLNELLAELSAVTQQLQTIQPISHCRFEISTHWNNVAQGFYRAHHSQRFSFIHDLRAVDHSPSYLAVVKGKQQHSQEKLQLTYNRFLPYKFSYYDIDTFEYREQTGSDDQFSLLGFGDAPVTLMKAIEAALVDVAAKCGNDLVQTSDIEHKMIGFWNIVSGNHSIGDLSVYPEHIVLIHDQQVIEGGYEIKNEGEYFRITIYPVDHEVINLAVDFIHSNYARMMFVDDLSQLIDFSTMFMQQPTAEGQVKLYRLGDLF